MLYEVITEKSSNHFRIKSFARWLTGPGSVITSYSIHYTKLYDPSTGKHELFRSPLDDGVYREATRLPEPVNTDTTRPYNVYVAPDESFMIACIADIQVGYNPGRANYFLFMRNDDRITSYNVCYTKLLRAKTGPAIHPLPASSHPASTMPSV